MESEWILNMDSPKRRPRRQNELVIILKTPAAGHRRPPAIHCRPPGCTLALPSMGFGGRGRGRNQRRKGLNGHEERVEVSKKMTQNHKMSMNNGAKMGSLDRFGRGGLPGGKTPPQKHSIWEVILETVGPMFRGYFFMCFFRRPLFRSSGDFWAPKVPRRLPKRSRNGVRDMLGGTSWEVLEPWYLLYWRHMGRSWGDSGRRLFPDRVSRPSLGASWGAPVQILGDFGCPLGCPGPPVRRQNGDLFQGLIFSHFLDHFWEGPAAGAGLPGP